MRPQSRNAVLLAVAVAVIATAVWTVGRLQRDTVAGSFRQTEAAHAILTAMLDQETSLRGYLQTGREDFLEPYRLGERELGQAVDDARRETDRGDRVVQRLIDRSETIALHWRRSADDAVAEVRRRGVRRVSVDEAVARKADMDQLRAANARLLRDLEGDRAAAMDRTSTVSVLLVLGISIAFALAGWLGIGRPAAARDRRDRRDARRRDRQAAFARSLQFMDSEEETHALVQRHLEQSIDASSVVVLQRNNSADRLEATTRLADGDPLAATLATATPRDCLAVRLGGARTNTDDDLLQCTVCGRSERELTTCTPLLVSGEVIGAVLVEHDEQLGDVAAQYVEDTVTQAAPVIANMRNLAIAERRASTDALTGLPNRRAIQDTLRRMFAQAARHDQSLAAVALDLDHFKQINDRYGHDTGDDVLAAVAQALTSTLRASDFVGRQGGEEFIALLPETGLDGAITAAENLRRAIAALRVPGLDRAVTASFGVAVFPEDAFESEVLLRQADRALYTAKHEGRDRVATAALATAFPQPAS